MPSCTRCLTGNLEQQVSGFYMCTECHASVAPGNIRDSEPVLNY